MDIFVESFKNYHYNRGSLEVALEGRALRLETVLDGEAGKRELKIIFHDVNTGKGAL